MRFDAVGNTLILAAHVTESGGAFALDAQHPLDAVAHAAKLRGRGWKKRYLNAAARLMDCNGLDLLNLSQEEQIDILVAAAFWESA